MQFNEAQELLARQGQGHLLRFWDGLDAAARAALLAQISSVDFNAVALMRAQLARHLGGGAEAAGAAEITPAPVAELSGAELAAAEKAGVEELRAGRVAALVVAGGQGSRLGYDGPKGCYGIGPVSNAPLFYFHARKVLALSRRHGAPVPFYIMTSETNDAATRAFFKERAFFDLDESAVFFFTQSMWPALDADGRIILEAPGRIAMAADGHGGALSALAASGGLADMRRRGVETVFYFQVDNPLVDVCSPAFIGFHKIQGADISVKVCAKRGPDEGLGVVVERGGKTAIVEYTEFTPAQKHERAADGGLRFKYGSVAIHVFSVPFLEREAAAGLPLHIAHKKVAFADGSGATVAPAAPNAYKFEKFIFDALADARSVRCLAFDRADEFAPVKNASGDDSPAACRAALVAKWRRWLSAAGVPPAPGAEIEIDPAFADSAAVLASALAGRAERINPSAPVIRLDACQSHAAW